MGHERLRRARSEGNIVVANALRHWVRRKGAGIKQCSVCHAPVEGGLCQAQSPGFPIITNDGFKKPAALKATERKAKEGALALWRYADEALLAEFFVEFLEDQFEHHDFVRRYSHFHFHLLGNFPGRPPLCLETTAYVIERCDNFLHRLEALVPCRHSHLRYECTPDRRHRSWSPILRRLSCCDEAGYLAQAIHVGPRIGFVSAHGHDLRCNVTASAEVALGLWIARHPLRLPH